MIMELLEYLGIALVGALFLVVMSKFVLQNTIRRENHYYENREAREERKLLEAAGITTDKANTDKEGKH